MWLLSAAYVAALVLHGAGWSPGWFDSVVNGWLGELTLWAPMAVCWLAAVRIGFRRPELLLCAAAVTAFAAGDTYFVLMSVGGGTLPFPSLADLGYVSFYPMMLAALVVAVRRHMRAASSSVWLDCAVGSLGATSVLAIVLDPVLASATVGPGSLAKAVAVAYPLFDLLLVAAVAGIAALGDARVGGRWGLLGGGFLIFAATDVIYGLQVTAGTYVLGTTLDAGWSIGLALVATWVHRASRREQPATHERGDSRPATDARALAVSVVATVAGLGVLVVGTRVHLSALAVTLAGVTLLAAAARSQLAFRRLSRMADQRRLAAATDELTGLPNRRALYAEGNARLLDPQREHQALLMLDLGKFKEVNDSLGHLAGDELLVQVGARLSEQLGADDVLARLGGDEFAILLADVGHEEAVDTAAKLGSALEGSFELEDIALHSSVSIGIALFPDDGVDLSTLLRKADIAMYSAKTSLQGHHVYCSSDDADGATRLQRAQELQTA